MKLASSIIRHSRSTPGVARWLRCIILLQCLGCGARYRFTSFETESDVYGLLYFDYGWSEQIAQRIDDFGAIACLLAGFMIVVVGMTARIDIGQITVPATKSEVAGDGASTNRPLIKLIIWCVDLIAMLVVFSWMLALAICHTLRGGMFAELTLGEHAVRIAAPIVLMLIAMRPQRERLAWAIAAFSAAITFAIHGYKALMCHGPFTDLILLTTSRFRSIEFSQSTAESVLLVIGTVDIVAAMVLIVFRWRMAALYMLLWGLITSASRMTAYGWSGWPDTLMRAANWGVPLAIVLLTQTTSKKRIDS